MSLSTVQIWQSIQEGEIASATDCRQWASEILTSAGNAALDNPQLMLAQLVKLGRLTTSQANALLSNHTQTLVIGRHRLLAQLVSPALSDWYEAIDPSSNEARWLYAISKDKLKEPAFDRHPPSLRLARQHASVRAVGLQNFSPPAFIDDYLLIAATPADGQPLRDSLKAYPRRVLPVDVAFKVVKKIARSLAAMHKEGIVHGRIGIDQIWWDGKEEVTLLRDPFFPPSTPLGPDVPTAIGVDDDQGYRVRYAAPEFTAPGQSPSQSTDVYALGCLWWELMTGQLPYSETMIDQVPTASCKFTLTIPNELGISQSQRRCLDHMLAKNPSTRFESAVQLVTALKVISPASEEPLPSSSPSPVAASLREASSKTAAPPTTPPTTPPTPRATTPSTSPPPREQPKPIQAPQPAPTKPEPPASITAPPQTTPEPVPQTKIAEITVKESKLEIPLAKQANPLAGKTPSAIDLNNLAPKAPTRSTVRKANKKASRPVWLIPSIIGGGIAVLSGLVGILTWSDGSSKFEKPTVAKQDAAPVEESPKSPTVSDGIPATSPIKKTRVIDPIEDQFMVSKADDSLPWVPPRPSQPYSLSMFPPGAQGFIFVRPSPWLTTQSGQTIVESLSASLDMIWKPVEKASGISIQSIDELAIGLYPGRTDGWPVMVFRFQMKEETSRVEIQERLSSAKEQTVNETYSILMNGDEAIFLGPKAQKADDPSRILTVGPPALIRELVDMEGGGAPLRRQMEQLWQASDAQSDLSLLLTTGFFFSDARSVLPSISPRVQALGKDLLDEKSQAVLITTSLEPNWYAEMRVLGTTGDDATRFTKEARERMKTIADAMESELIASPATPYWRAIAGRYPQMLRSLGRYQRFGIENGQAIWNFYLPSSASANMSIATWMAVQTPVAAVANSTNAPSIATVKKLSGDDLLAYPISINFEQEPLDSALALLTDEINRSLPAGTGPLTLSIDGKAFELSSVTRNQQIRDYRFKEQPLRDLLTDLVKRVNPDRTVKSLDEVKQAVVWILSETDGKPSVLFTTRRGIEGSDKKLPKEFVAP